MQSIKCGETFTLNGVALQALCEINEQTLRSCEQLAHKRGVGAARLLVEYAYVMLVPVISVQMDYNGEVTVTRND